VPHIGDILEAMEDAYDKAAGMGDEAVAFAARYDADRVMAEHWLPILDDVTAPREIEPLRLAA
jgi:hypothetical protein